MRRHQRPERSITKSTAEWDFRMSEALAHEYANKDYRECRHSRSRETIKFAPNEFGFRDGIRESDGTV